MFPADAQGELTLLFLEEMCKTGNFRNVSLLKPLEYASLVTIPYYAMYIIMNMNRFVGYSKARREIEIRNATY
jgi:hypothetical protein